MKGQHSNAPTYLKSVLSYLYWFGFSTVFWIGDLNYRIDDMDINDVKDKISRDELGVILPNDQVRMLYKYII